MSLQDIATLLRLYSPDGTLQARYQNGNIGELTWEGESYPYLSFLYRGAARNRTGDNLQAELLLASHPLSMDVVLKALQGEWTVEVLICATRAADGQPVRVLSSDTWIIASPSYDPETLTVTLGSAIDAVGASAPMATFTSRLVGSLPISGQIQSI